MVEFLLAASSYRNQDKLLAATAVRAMSHSWLQGFTFFIYLSTIGVTTRAIHEIVVLYTDFFLYIFRHIIASLHFNENLKRSPRTTEDGRTYTHVTYPKGEEVVREIGVPPTYGKITCYLNTETSIFIDSI